jgi:hypothetical protein
MQRSDFDGRRKRTRSRLLRVLVTCCAALLVLSVLSVCVPTKTRAVHGGKTALDPLVRAIEKHHAIHGRYPASLDELAAGSSLVRAAPSHWNMLEEPAEYQTSRDRSVFCLKFGYTGVFDRHGTCVYYLSTNGTWLDKPYNPPDIDWEAALLHGQHYQATHSGKSLEAAATSLMHANVDWLPVPHIEDVLGEARSSHAIDDAECFEIRYDSDDGTTYVFVIDEWLLKEVHWVTRDECGNEGRTVLKRYADACGGR